MFVGYSVGWLVGVGGLFSWLFGWCWWAIQLVGWWAIQLAGVGGLYSWLVSVGYLVFWLVGGLSSWLVLVGYSVSSLVGVGGL